MFRATDAFVSHGSEWTFPSKAPSKPGWARRLLAGTELWVANPATLALLLFAVAIAARVAQFGNPVVQVDDQFYLLVGDRMLHGALPFVDVWDRKPIGLFLLYAGIRLLGGGGVIQYQIVATLFAALTAFVIARIALRGTNPHGAAAAGVVYILYLGVFGGEAGQSPVFYNLLVACAGLTIVRVLERPHFDRISVSLGAAAMLLIGISLQVKYSTVFEGALFGVVLMLAARADGWPLARVLSAAILWAGISALPTVAAWLVYVAIGHNAEFVQANFLSILARGSDGTGIAAWRLVQMTLGLMPLLCASWMALSVKREAETGVARRVRHFVLTWAVCAIAGVLVFGAYFDHYALPLLLPLSLCAAPLFGDPNAGIAIVGGKRTWRISAGLVVMIIATAISIPAINKNRRDRGWGPQVEKLAAFIQPRLGDGCLFVFHGEPALYQMTNSCFPTRWIFPNHLNYRREANALGVDAVAETSRIMATRPKLVVTSTKPERDVNPATWAVVQAGLARDYDLAFAQPVGSRMRLVYQLKSGR
ncbi:hypothetical protein IAG41_11330 [Sphingomonas sp. JC676]|uniref:ArnT family glycosyltransferase n=1 Tax=Sphingomonas sp. JC676 TaxID=2768065 RepID=UPI00165848D9|nr:hypothetical protein [Sphingomonas sp. JC676]MBC9032987.1 hypothetical protein [Sphingomonas sp. JC676]